MLSGDAATGLARRWQTQIDLIGTRAAEAKTAAWDSLGSWNERDIDRFDRAVRSIDEAAKRAAVSATDAYYSTLMEVSVAGVDPDAVPTVRPDPRDPFTTLWHRLKVGDQFADGLDAGRSAAANGIRTHVVDSSRSTGDAWAESSGLTTRWRRILTGVSCEWCALVSTQMYRSAASATFGHKTCDCLVVPVDAPSRGTSLRRRGVIDQDMADRLRELGVQERIAAQQAPSRSSRAAANAERRRDEARAEMAQERDPERRRRLEDRARKWDRDAKKYRARAAEEAARSRPPSTSTGYVTPDGHPAPRP